MVIKRLQHIAVMSTATKLLSPFSIFFAVFDVTDLHCNYVSFFTGCETDIGTSTLWTQADLFHTSLPQSVSSFMDWYSNQTSSSYMAGTVPEFIYIVPGKVRSRNCVTNVWEIDLPVLSQFDVCKFFSSILELKTLKLELYWARVGSSYSSTRNSLDLILLPCDVMRSADYSVARYIFYCLSSVCHDLTL